MRHIRTTWILLALVVSAVSIATAQPGYRSYRGGNCSGPVWASWRDANINLVQTRNGYALVNGPYTTIAVTQLRTQLIPGPTVPGHCADEVVAALQELSNQGYYTVDVAVFRSGGWLISGNRNREQERRVAEEQTRRAEAARQRQLAQTSRRSSNSSSRNSNSGNSCEVRLYSQLGSPIYKLEDFIEVTGEHINVNWGTTEVNQGEPYELHLYIENRAGDRRELRNGDNWVEPGRYKIFLTYSRIRSTSLTASFKCN